MFMCMFLYASNKWTYIAYADRQTNQMSCKKERKKLKATNTHVDTYK